MSDRFTLPYASVFDSSGNPMSGALLYFYTAGTTTPKATYSNFARTSANTNPVVADASGRFGDIYLGSGAYKAVLKTSAGVTVWTADNVLSSIPDWLTVKQAGATGDGVADDRQAFVDAISTLSSRGGGTLYVPAGTYRFGSATPVALVSNVNILFEAGATISNTNTGDAGIFSLAAGVTDVTISGPGRLHGPYTGSTPAPSSASTAYPNGNGAVRINGTAANPCYRIRIEGVTIKGWGQYGVFGEGCWDCHFVGNHIEKIGRDGIRLYGAKDCSVNLNRISNITPGVSGVAPNLNAYGVTFTRNATSVALGGGTTTNPPSQRCTCIGNIVTDVPTWKPLDTHGGQQISFIGNVIRGGHIGIGIDEGDTTGSAGDSPPKDIIVEGNIIERDTGNADGAAVNVSSSSTSAKGERIVIRNNICRDFGDSNGGQINLNYANGVQVTGNFLKNSQRAGICVKTDCLGVHISANTIEDMTGSIVGAIAVESTDSTTNIESGTFIRTTGSFTAFSLAAPGASYSMHLGDDFTYIGTITKFSSSAHRTRPTDGSWFRSVKAWGRVTSAGAKSGTCYGISTAAKNSTGNYTVTLSEALASTNNVVTFLTPRGPDARIMAAEVASTTSITVYTFDAAGVATDNEFTIAVCGV